MRVLRRDVTRLGLGGDVAAPQTDTGISLFYTAVLDIMLL